MIRFLAGVDPAAAAPIIRKTLMESTEERLISTCLQIMTRSEDLDLVRPLLKHQRWHVRMQTAATLGRIGLPSDEALLVGVLADPQWWVRYRAAQALLKMSHVGEAGLRRIAATHADKYARDIVNQVLAEHAMGITTSGTV
jgi:HEAT repeat protein